MSYSHIRPTSRVSNRSSPTGNPFLTPSRTFRPMSSIAAHAHTPSPTQTPAPAASSSSSSPSPLRRKRQPDHRSWSSFRGDWQRRADNDSTSCGSVIGDQTEIDNARQQCQYNSSNAVYSCFPENDSLFVQHQWSPFIWNSHLPQFTQDNVVDLYLYHADSLDQVLNVTNYPNPYPNAGQYDACVDDAWFGSRGANWDGQNITYEYFWEISPVTATAAGDKTPLATFTVVQTTYLDAVVSSMSSASAASVSSASASSAAAASSRSAASASSTASGTVGTGIGGGNSTTTASPSSRNPTASTSGGAGSGNVQSLASDNFPHWAIAVIVVLGFLALVAAGILAFFITRRVRNRRNSMLSHRGSMNSASPMMANAATGATAQSPLLGGAALGGAAGTAETGEGRATSPTEGHDGASTMSRVSADGLFSGADAAIMAAAFRSALRKPDFADRPGDEGESPEGSGATGPSELLGQELAEEGRDIRSVGSSRGVRVETLSDAADDDAATTIQDDAATTVQDHPH